MRTIKVKVMSFGELTTEHARGRAHEVVKDLYGDESMDASYAQAAEDVAGYAKDLGLTGLKLKPGKFCMNFNIDDRPYGDASEGDDIEFPIEDFISDLLSKELIPVSMDGLLNACRWLARCSNDANSSECETDNARLAVIRELSKVYYDFISSDEEYMETRTWAEQYADLNGMVFDANGNDASDLLSRHIIENVIKYN
jgi:hypothetical protein